MRTVAALIAGLLLSMTTFAAGLVVAITFLNAGEREAWPDGRETATLWTTEPTTVDKASQSLERLPPRPVPKEKKVAAISKEGAGARAEASTGDLPATDVAVDEALVDRLTTGSVDAPDLERDPSLASRQVADHVDWCARRYRSYSPEDNTYRPYGGGRRTCQSPYSGLAARAVLAEDADTGGNLATLAEDEAATGISDPGVEQASFDEMAEGDFDGDHVRSCFARYRSYRPADNSYQPYDGGPRRQCR